MEDGMYFLLVNPIKFFKLNKGIGFLTMDIYNEVWNSLLYHFTNKFAAPWLCNLKTTYLVLVGSYQYYFFILLFSKAGILKLF